MLNCAHTEGNFNGQGSKQYLFIKVLAKENLPYSLGKLWANRHFHNLEECAIALWFSKPNLGDQTYSKHHTHRWKYINGPIGERCKCKNVVIFCHVIKIITAYLHGSVRYSSERERGSSTCRTYLWGIYFNAKVKTWDRACRLTYAYKAAIRTHIYYCFNICIKQLSDICDKVVPRVPCEERWKQDGESREP